MTTRVLVAHQHALLADALATMLAGAPDVDVVGVARGATHALEASRLARPDVVVAGSVPGLELSEVVASGAAVLVVADEPSTADVLRAMDAGVTGYLTMTCSAQQLADAVWRVAAGEVVVLGVEGRAQAPRPIAVPIAADAALVDLTPREREILTRICAGRSNREIAKELFISQHTVRTHVQNIRSKLKVGSKLEAALMAVRVAPEGQGGYGDRRPDAQLQPAAGWRG
jgi:two-component system NarL family response regulator